MLHTYPRTSWGPTTGAPPGAWCTDGDGCDDCSSGTFDPSAGGSDADGDGICDSTDTCTDVDGDGIGTGTAGNSGCLDPTNDSDDTNPNACADTDADGCDDCQRGIFNPGADGPDADGDGICDGPAGGDDTDGDGVTDGVDKEGVDAKRLVAVGYGQTQPIASNTTERGRTLNRRVAFTITLSETTAAVVSPAPPDAGPGR